MADPVREELPPGCPPDAASAAEGTFFRLVKPSLQEGETAGSEDWIVPHRKRKSECSGTPEICECHAHSLIAELEDIRQARESVPWLRKKAVAQVELGPEMGRVLKWPTDVFLSHFEWWPSPADLVPHSVVVEAAPA